MASAAPVAQLKAHLNHQCQVRITDGRCFKGMFMCTDRDQNVILSMAHEYRGDNQRYVGLIMIPGPHIVAMYSEPLAAPDALSAAVDAPVVLSVCALPPAIMLDLFICIVGIYACFLSWGVLQERVSTTPYGEDGQKFRYFIFLNVIQGLVSATVAVVYLGVLGKPVRRPSWPLLRRYVQAALTNALASPFGYAALQHIDYPTLTLTKSCKLVPVILMNVVLYRRRFPLHKYATVILVTAGVSGFMLLQPVSSGKRNAVASSSVYGLLLVLVNLLMDGVTNSTQDQIFHEFREVTGQHMMLFMNLLGALLMALWLLSPWNPELQQAMAFAVAFPQVWEDILLFSLCGALGQCFIFYTLARFGSLSLVMVTVTRKLFTMLLSVFWFGHELSLGQWLSVAVVFSGIGLEAYVKRQEKLALAAHNATKSIPAIDEKMSISLLKADVVAMDEPSSKTVRQRKPVNTSTTS
ncbi:UDP-galactose transporter [Dimargaris xerosporica]|nr:UDP-galactose transporter [Dimargaris xerosporica]